MPVTKSDAGGFGRSVRLPMSAHRILIVPARMRGGHGQTYDAFLVPADFKGGPGKAPRTDKLASGTADAELAACRALVARGFTGTAETWRPGENAPALCFRDIETAARLTVREGTAHGPRFSTYRPLDRDRLQAIRRPTVQAA